MYIGTNYYCLFCLPVFLLMSIPAIFKYLWQIKSVGINWKHHLVISRRAQDRLQVVRDKKTNRENLNNR